MMTLSSIFLIWPNFKYFRFFNFPSFCRAIEGIFLHSFNFKDFNCWHFWVILSITVPSTFVPSRYKYSSCDNFPSCASESGDNLEHKFKLNVSSFRHFLAILCIALQPRRLETSLSSLLDCNLCFFFFFASQKLGWIFTQIFISQMNSRHKFF